MDGFSKPFGQPADEAEPFPADLIPLWDRLDPDAQERIHGPWPALRGFNYRAATLECLLSLRAAGWTVSQATRLAAHFPHGLGRLNFMQIITELWIQITADEREAAHKRDEAEAAARPDRPDPVNLFGEAQAAPALKPEHLPTALWGFVTDTAERLGVDPAAVGISALVACAAVIHDGWQIQPKRHDYTWAESARLWSMILGEPSILKTPVISACTRPIDKLEIDARKLHDDAMRRWKADCEIAKTDNAPAPFQPRLDRFLVEGTTLEALSEILRSDHEAKMHAPAGKLLCRQDELSEFVAGMDRYRAGGKGGSDRGAFLRSFNGGRYTMDRVGRGSFVIPNWSLCILGGCQPGPIQRIAQGADDDGLLQRFMFVVPERQGHGVDRRPDQDALNRYAALFPALANYGPVKSSDADQVRPVVFHAAAHQHREEIDQLRAVMAIMPDTSSRLRSAFGKWSGLFARLCLTFHLIDIADNDARGQQSPPVDVVSAETASRVSKLMFDVLLPHLLRADAMMFGTVDTGHAQWIAGYILAQKLERITIRDITRAYKQLRAPETKKTLVSVMEGLIATGWLEPEEPSNPAKGVSAWLVNPRAHEMFAERSRAEAERRAAEKALIAQVTAGRRQG